MVRYEYADDSDRPTLIARPSVVPGKEHQVRIAYNAHGQPLSVTETGFSPINDQGEKTATPITRTVTYSYRTINNRSVLTAIDGPLPNGPHNDPGDSDVTRVEYDPRGTALAVVSPGGFKSSVRYDEAGRIATVGQTPWPSQPVQAHATLAARSVAPAIAFDGLARPVAWQGGGQTLLKASWGEAGTAAQFRMLALASGNGEARRLVDDFGRVVAIRNPGMGWQTAAYDAASRLVHIIDPRGAVQVAHYDFASRLLRLVRYPAAQAAPEETLTLRWQGRLKTEAAVADAEGTRRTLWRHDAEGRLVEEIQEIALKGAVPVRFAVRRNLDEAGERIELADASGAHSTLLQSRDAQGRVEAMRLAGWLPDWLGGGRALVKEIGWTQVEGLPFASRVVYGDGRIDRWPLERPGTAARTVALAQDSVHPVNGLERPGADHDAAGLPAVLDTEAGRLKLAWDAAGRLAAISQGGQHERFIYDAQGRRVAKRIGEHIRYFAYDGIQLAGEADETGKLLIRYAYLGYRPIAQIIAPQGAWQRFVAWLVGPQARTYATSKSGRVLAMHDDNGRVVWQDTGAASVRRASLAGQTHQPLRDVGQYADDESGLIYHMARFFDPGTGFFLSPDPKGIADVVEHTRPDLLLNPYAYAGGDPEEFFDPDGAAKIRYYAITTGDLGAKKGYGSLGMDQGFTKARWAFVIYDIQGGGDANTELGKLRNQYGATSTGLLFDGQGDFIGSPNDPLTGITNPTKTAIKQEGGSGALSKAFVDHYAGNIIGLPQFDVEFDDDNATKLIWYLMTDPAKRTANCKTNAPGWLPEIRFAAEEAPIKVTSASYGDASKQRILACGEGANANLDQRRIAKYEAAAEINETARINRDCQATRRFDPPTTSGIDPLG
jgi:RHS repeat-associated protein